MLVLARKRGESIVIGDNIVVKVVGIENGIVKLGIDAPKEIAIMRSELRAEVEEQNRAAVHISEQSELDALSKLLKK